jgi:hypothetical protein
MDMDIVNHDIDWKSFEGKWLKNIDSNSDYLGAKMYVIQLLRMGARNMGAYLTVEVHFSYGDMRKRVIDVQYWADWTPADEDYRKVVSAIFGEEI